jgi:prolipoprotein diacylglyceryltransferase
MERSTRVEQAPGTVTGVALVVWGLVRALDEHLLLGQESGSGSVGVQIAGLAMALGGLVILVSVARKLQKAELIH